MDSGLSLKEYFRSRWIWFALALTLFVVAIILFRSVIPAPPTTITIAGGSAGGAYAETVEGYAKAVAPYIRAEVAPSNGSKASLALLKNNEVQAAIIQGGVASEKEKEGMESLGGLFFEPVWVFYWAPSKISELADFEGKKVAIGPEGSGTRALMKTLLQYNRITEDNAQLLDLPLSEAEVLLRRGQIDAMVVVAGERSKRVHDLIETASVALMPFIHAKAYSRREPYLAEVVLPRGSVDFVEDLPPEDVTLIAPTAQLVVRSDLHPAIQALLAETISAQHRSGDLFSAPGEFPNILLVDVPLAAEASRYFKNGPSFFRRFFSYDWANFIERTWVFLLPIIPLFIAVSDIAPPLWEWQIRRRIYVWYGLLRELETEGRACGTEECRDEVVRKVRALQLEAATIKVPKSYHDEIYQLREHIELVENILVKLDEETLIALSSPSSPAAK